ncbi:MAG: NUDIX domain-containing protein [Phycisphaeraceae bacterium]|nr:NUDIX domain-containing protein [Phycisphaeraceae bacterium]
MAQVHGPARLFRLRRPALLQAQPGRFVPLSVGMDEVDQAWSCACERNPRLFDGPLWHVAGCSRNGHGGVTLHVIESSYRFHAVRAIGVETGVRPLGVKGIVWRNDQVLIGQRSSLVHAEPNRWEFVPGGTLEPGVQPAVAVTAELREEARWMPTRTPVPTALLFDDAMCTWELIHELDATPIPTEEFKAPPIESWELRRLASVSPTEVPQRPLTRSAQLMLPLLWPRRPWSGVQSWESPGAPPGARS